MAPSEIYFHSDYGSRKPQKVYPGENHTYQGPKREKVEIACVPDDCQTTVTITERVVVKPQGLRKFLPGGEKVIDGSKAEVVLREGESHVMLGGGTLSLESLSITHKQTPPQSTK